MITFLSACAFMESHALLETFYRDFGELYRKSNMAYGEVYTLKLQVAYKQFKSANNIIRHNQIIFIN